MQDTKVGTRYAKSLIKLALEQGLLENVYADMKLILRVCDETRELVTVLKSPIIKSDKKESIIKSVFASQLNPLTLEFLQIMTRKKRESYLLDIAKAFIDQYKTHKKILTAVITTAYGLDDEVRKKVQEIVTGATKSEVELIEKVDKNIIGGFILRVGDKQDDTSISRKIKNLNRTFNENPYIKEY